MRGQITAMGKSNELRVKSEWKRVVIQAQQLHLPNFGTAAALHYRAEPRRRRGEETPFARLTCDIKVAWYPCVRLVVERRPYSSVSKVFGHQSNLSQLYTHNRIVHLW